MTLNLSIVRGAALFMAFSLLAKARRLRVSAVSIVILINIVMTDYGTSWLFEMRFRVFIMIACDVGT